MAEHPRLRTGRPLALAFRRPSPAAGPAEKAARRTEARASKLGPEAADPQAIYDLQEKAEAEAERQAQASATPADVFLQVVQAVVGRGELVEWLQKSDRAGGPLAPAEVSFNPYS